MPPSADLPAAFDQKSPAVPARAEHPLGPAYLDRLDRALSRRERHRRFFRRLTDPILFWQLAAALTHLFLG